MLCPCGAAARVLDSRPFKSGAPMVQESVRRRRRCLECGRTWTTVEVDRASLERLVRVARLMEKIRALV